MAKFYAVKVGKIPGIYKSWAECEAQVKGYKGASYKSFNNEEDAKAFAGITSSLNLSNNDKEIIEWELRGIQEGLKARDIEFILEKVYTIAEMLNINIEKEDIKEYMKQ